jgi:hypothetical protein
MENIVVIDCPCISKMPLQLPEYILSNVHVRTIVFADVCKYNSSIPLSMFAMELQNRGIFEERLISWKVILICMYSYAYICMCICVCIYIHMQRYITIYIHTWKLIYMNTYFHIQINGSLNTYNPLGTTFKYTSTSFDMCI